MTDASRKIRIHNDPMVIHLKRPHISTDLIMKVPTPPEPTVPGTLVISKKKKRYIPLRTIFLIGIIALICIGAYVFAFARLGAPTVNTVVPIGQTALVQASGDVVQRVGQLILLPSDEVPTLATVSDINVLKGQLFFQNASNGDVVLMYAKARKAILYSPRLNKVIEVAPITDAETAQ